MVDRENGKIENSVGDVEDWDGVYLTLKPNSPKFNVETIILRKDVIRSIWVYKDAEGVT